MNWGKTIVIVLAVFILFISGMGLVFFLSPTDDYDHEYYEKGLTFNRDYDRELQVNKDHAKPVITYDAKNITITFTSPVKGKIKFMRPSDTGLDKYFNLNSGNDNKVEFPLTELPKGQWQIEMAWEANHKAYLNQQEVYIK